MKIAIRAFLFIFFLISLLYCGWLNIELLITHANSKNALSHFSDQQQSELIKIPVCQLDKDQSDEVWFHDKLFDVVKRERIHDTVYVYVAPDKDEQDVLDMIFDHFRSEDCLASEDVNRVSPLKHISRAIDWHYILRQPQESFHPIPGICTINIKASPELTGASEVLTPPPRKIHLPETLML
ncbi:MAG TPA: hypothetical protein VF939_26155 [Puia sp.]